MVDLPQGKNWWYRFLMLGTQLNRTLTALAFFSGWGRNIYSYCSPLATPCLEFKTVARTDGNLSDTWS